VAYLKAGAEREGLRIGRCRKPRSNLVAINEREGAVMDANVNDPLAATGLTRDDYDI
jgi:hypothetical protein